MSRSDRDEVPEDRDKVPYPVIKSLSPVIKSLTRGEVPAGVRSLDLRNNVPIFSIRAHNSEFGFGNCIIFKILVCYTFITDFDIPFIDKLSKSV